MSVRLVAPYRTAPSRGTLWLGFEVHLDEGWHIYWKNSGDAGYPPVMELEARPALEGAKLLFPAPRRFPVAGGLVAIGYEDRVIYPIRARLPPSEAETLEVTGSFDYLVCEEDCIPFHDELSLRLPLGESYPDPEIESRLETWRARLPRPIEELPTVDTRLTLSGDELVLDVVTPDDEAPGAPELFLEPVQGVEFGEPRSQSGPTGLRFRVSLSPRDTEVGLPHGSKLSYVLTGLRGEESLLAVEATNRIPAPVGETASPEVETIASTDLVREGLLLGLSPSVLALLGLLVLLTHREIRDELGALSEIWPFAAGAFAGFLTLCLGFRLWNLGGLPTPFATPWVVVAGTLPALGLTLWLWLGHPSRIRHPRSMTRDLGSGFLAPLLALPWMPAAGSLAPLASGRGTVTEAATTAAGFAAPFLVTGALVTWLGGRETSGRRSRWEDALGFLASTTLIWVSYRLLDLLPTDRVAFVQLTWLGTGLSAHLGTVSKRTRAAWIALTVVLGGVSVFVALS
ncbi:MAG: protein-disulfide reductase DsbD family protein [Thermoanaerobaculia bacterium]|nr:protein-disulfide reductase DsbD family protein [Thermoanaerobaculia bacterium]